MNLSKKTLLYSTLVSIVIVALIVGYFILMLPSLYVDYIGNSNYNSIVALQEGYMKSGSYDNLEVKNPTGTITAEIPFEGNTIYFTNKFFVATINVQDEELMGLIDKIRYYAKHKDEIENIDIDEFDLPMLRDKLLLNGELEKNYPLKFKFDVIKNDNIVKETSSELHVISDDLYVYEMRVTDSNNYYTTYMALGITEEGIAITALQLMTPQIKEIKPVIFHSLPMIVAVAFLFVLIFSQVFSNNIVNPIIKLANHAAYLMNTKNLEVEPLVVSGNDEVSVLGRTLNELYLRLQENYKELEEKNKYLADENKRQEVFLRASSHQLKTPIAAALLLVEGMINEVGKFKDVSEYLPQVKKQIQSMQKIVEDILYLNHCSMNIQMEELSPETVMEDCIHSFDIQIAEKSLEIMREGRSSIVKSDRELLKKVLENLLSNAINYSPEQGRIHINYENQRICIKNYGVTIDEELLPHIFEPFVTNNGKNKGHGLGLYIVAYYVNFLDCQVKISNFDGGVKTELIFT